MADLDTSDAEIRQLDDENGEVKAPEKLTEPHHQSSASQSDLNLPLKFRTVREDLVRAINNDRKQAGLAQLEFDESLSRIADKHCEEMGTLVYTGHISKDGRAPYQRYFDAGCKDHIFENVGGADAGDSEKFVVHENSLSSIMFETHASFMMAEPPVDLHRRNVLRYGVTHVGIGIHYSDKHFRLVEVFASRYLEFLDKSPDGSDTAPGFTLTTDETYLFAKCKVSGFGIVGCVVYYEPHPSEMRLADIDGVTVYEDSTPERVAVVWPWEMERLPGGVVHIPIFLNSLQNGLYYAQVLICSTTKTIPYDGPSEDLDFSAPYIIPAAGLIFNCSKEVDTSAWSGLGVSMHGADVEGLDMVVAGIEPFSEIVVSKGSEPVILGFKRQIILSQGRGGEAPLVVSVANAPGLPPVVGVTLLSGDSDLGSLSIPEGYEVLEPNLIDVLRESDTLRNAFGLPPIASLAGDEDGAVHESLNALAFNPRSLYLAVKRQVEASMSRDLDDDALAEAKRDDELLLDCGVCLTLINESMPSIPNGYQYTATNVSVTGPTEDGTGSELGATVVLAWSTQPEAVGEVLAQREADKREAEEEEEALRKSSAEVPIISDAPIRGGAGGKQQADILKVGHTNVDVGIGDQLEGQLDSGSIDSGLEDVTTAVTRKAQDKQKLLLLLREAQEEQAKLQADNKHLQRVLAAFFVVRQAEEEKTAEQVGTAASLTDGSMPGSTTASVGPVRSAEELEQSYLETLQQVVVEKKKIAAFLSRCDAQAMELQGRLDEKEGRAQEIHKSFVEFKREIARAAENSRTGKPIPKQIIAQFEATELAKDKEVEKVRLKNIHLKFQLRKLEGKIKEKEQLAEGLHLIDFEQLKIENQTLNEKIEDRNEELGKLKKKLTQTVQVLTHVREKLQFVQGEADSKTEQLSSLASDVALNRDLVARKKLSRERLRSENDKLKSQRGFVNNDSLVIDFESRKKHIKELEQEINELRDRFMFLSTQSKTATISSTK